MLRAVAEVEDDRLALRGAPIVLRQHRRDVFVRQPVEAVPAHAAVGDRLGQRERLRHRRRAAVERRVEARHLRQVRRAREHGPDRREIVRLVQRRERDVFFQRGQDRRIHAHGLRVFHAAVHHPVADPRQPMLGELGAQESDQMIERVGVGELDPITPRLLAEHLSGAVLGDEARRRMQTLGLPARNQLQLVTALGEHRELEARRARVQNGDCVGHVSAHHLRPPPCRPSRAARSPPALRCRTKRGVC